MSGGERRPLHERLYDAGSDPEFGADVLARLVAVREHLEVGDVSEAVDVLRDLEDDLASVLEEVAS